MNKHRAEKFGLYNPANEHDSCGVGFIAQIEGKKTHGIIEKGLDILKNIDHRGAVGADPLMGDGAGITIQIPHNFFKSEMKKQGVDLPGEGEYGVGIVFLPKEKASRLACEKSINRSILLEGQRLLGWRDVPTDDSMPISPRVVEKKPVIRQFFVGRGPETTVQDALERKLLVIRKSAYADIKKLNLKHGKEFYIPSFSSRTIVYKGLLLSNQVGEFYLDLKNKKCVSALALVHQRFSTNTFPEWSLAHPFRMVAHNGEINTVKGNFNWLRARQGVMSSPVLGDDLKKLYPINELGQSDTSVFDNCLELLTASGYPLSQAVMMMIPEPWEQNNLMEIDRRSFYEYFAPMMEPWDGPASMVFTDGKQIGATLDRNGLRPSRYCVTDDGFVVMASETGVLPISESSIVKKWRLQPGKMFLIDLEQGRLIDDEELKNTIAKARPFKSWVENLTVKLKNLKVPGVTETEEIYKTTLLEKQKAFGFSREDVKFLLTPMLMNAQEGTGSMGNDTPLAVLSSNNKVLYNYFRQLFAQVTNPPIDPIRESIVMSLISYIGPRPNLLDINQINPLPRLEVLQPILDFSDIKKLKIIHHLTKNKFKSKVLNICFPVEWGSEGIEAQLSSLCAASADAVKDGFNILILSDKSISCDSVAMPALLALSAVHQHLVQEGLRTQTGLVVETGSAREVHHFATLAGYGAEAVHPYVALETIRDIASKSANKISEDDAIKNYIQAIGKGFSKIMSKMGISTYMSYCGAQIFEIVGINKDTIDKYFSGTSSAVEGVSVFEIAEEALRVHKKAFENTIKPPHILDVGGEYEWRVRGEQHMWTPDAIAKLQHSVRGNDWSSYEEFAQIINNQNERHMTLRGLFSLRSESSNSIPIADVEPASEIVKRFATGAMSLGSISTEAHVGLAIAMNRLGGKSNTGEGGEDKYRYRSEMLGKNLIENGSLLSKILPNADIQSEIVLKKNDSLRSKIKQVASGRFGVTTEYLASADQIQIKISQGAKPGEGGQLPGGKVSEYIGSLRYSVPGVGLISPPPHHDIYSIEDIAQLIHDLKNVSPTADISVKLVSEIGVGTVAAGVAKAKSDHIVIAGHDGGTGASPLSSIKHAGSPWEIGLAETQQTLVINGLRNRVRLQADGQMKTGRDVVIAGLLGADEMGFATAPLVAEGCIMMRKCHLNTCPVGIATQDKELRKRFSGQPEHVVNYFFFVAEEVRQIMAKLGVSKFDDLVGNANLLDTKKGLEHWKAKGLDFSRLFHVPLADKKQIRQTTTQDHGLDKALDNILIKKSQVTLNSKKKSSFKEYVKNVNRTVGALLSGELIRRYPDGLEDNTLKIDLQGTGGQSFGAFLARGITLNLQGEANDYTGKGLSGGKIIVRPSPDFVGPSHDNIIVGNTVLYGATSGEAFFSGVAGERFAVRLSGAKAVIEGLGDHGCEYMTGGTVVVLGSTGRNFAAGMSGGISYVFDPHKQLKMNTNLSMVALEPLMSTREQMKNCPPELMHLGEFDEVQLKKLIEDHFHWTKSVLAKSILNNWGKNLKNFVKVFPHEYRRALGELQKNKIKGTKHLV